VERQPIARATRRAVLAGIVAAAWPLGARTEQSALPIVGFLNPRSPSKGEAVTSAFLHGLHDGGYDEGRNVAVEYRWAEDQYDRLPALAADLVARGVKVIVAGGGTWVAAKGATSSIPIVFTSGLDPVANGMVKSLNRPEANLTGATFYSGGPLFAKQLELLRELVPNVAAVAMLAHPSSPSAAPQVKDAEAAARRNGVTLRVVDVADASGLDAAFAAVQADAMLLSVDPFFDSRPGMIVAGAARRRVPMMYYAREFVEAGGLICYGASIRDTYRQAGLYAARILAGATPAELPVVLPTRFELVINRKTAKALGLAIPATLLATADQVIE
jgi:putative tryptophan/tyrosine transport system substrate-binding protein